LCAAVGGDLELSARSRKRLDVDFEPARFVRLVRDPFAVGRELALALLKRSLQERERLFIAGDRQDPNRAAVDTRDLIKPVAPGESDAPLFKTVGK